MEMMFLIILEYMNVLRLLDFYDLTEKSVSITMEQAI